MKVLHIGKYFPPFIGGIENHTAWLIQELNKVIRADILVANDCFKTTQEEYHGGQLTRVAELTNVFSTSLCPTMPFVLRDLMKKQDYDILHIHFPNPMAHLASWFIPKKVKLILSWHSDIIKQKNILKLYRPFFNQIIRKADVIVAGTPKHFTSSEQLKIVASDEKFRVVPYCIDFERLQQTTHVIQKVKELRDRANGRKVIFAFGRHVYYKGFSYLIEAMKELPDTLLYLGGKGPLIEEFQKQIAMNGLEERVVLVGRVSDEDLPAYYHVCDVFCLPSIHPSEAFGLVQVEAMACEKPVVCCELNNGVTHVNQHEKTGLVTPPRDARALAVALRSLLQNDVWRKELGSQAKVRVLKEFTPDHMREKMLEVYDEVLK